MLTSKPPSGTSASRFLSNRRNAANPSGASLRPSASSTAERIDGLPQGNTQSKSESAHATAEKSQNQSCGPTRGRFDEMGLVGWISNLKALQQCGSRGAGQHGVAHQRSPHAALPSLATAKYTATRAAMAIEPLLRAP